MARKPNGTTYRRSRPSTRDSRKRKEGKKDFGKDSGYVQLDLLKKKRVRYVASSVLVSDIGKVWVQSRASLNL